MVTHKASAAPHRTVQSTVVIMKMSSLLGPQSAGPSDWRRAASAAVSDVGGAGPEAVGCDVCCGPTFSSEPERGRGLQVLTAPRLRRPTHVHSHIYTYYH